MSEQVEAPKHPRYCNHPPFHPVCVKCTLSPSRIMVHLRGISLPAYCTSVTSECPLTDSNLFFYNVPFPFAFMSVLFFYYKFLFFSSISLPSCRLRGCLCPVIVSSFCFDLILIACKELYKYHW